MVLASHRREAATCDFSLGGAVETLKEPGAHFTLERLYI